MGKGMGRGRGRRVGSCKIAEKKRVMGCELWVVGSFSWGVLSVYVIYSLRRYLYLILRFETGISCVTNCRRLL